MGVNVNKVTSHSAKMLKLEYNKDCKVAYGVKNDYNIVIKATADENKQILLSIWFTVSKELRYFDRRLLRGTKYQNAQFEKSGYMTKLTWNTGHSIEESAMKNFCDMVNWLLKVLQEEEYVNCDERGYAGICDTYFYDDTIHFLNKTSKDIIQKGKEEEIEAYMKRKENAPYGMLGTIVPALLGAAILFVLKDFGKIVFLAGIVMGLGGGIWYRKLAGKFTIVSITICFTIFLTVSCLIYPFMLKYDFGQHLLAGPVFSLVFLFLVLIFSKPKIKIVKLEED